MEIPSLTFPFIFFSASSAHSAHSAFLDARTTTIAQQRPDKTSSVSSEWHDGEAVEISSVAVDKRGVSVGARAAQRGGLRLPSLCSMLKHNAQARPCAAAQPTTGSAHPWVSRRE